MCIDRGSGVDSSAIVRDWDQLIAYTSVYVPVVIVLHDTAMPNIRMNGMSFASKCKIISGFPLSIGLDMALYAIKLHGRR